ncbi:unnamed protein product [Diabrotica balteata]|uniref:Uncharacterized protein n=1 Tax=Diabrotica balteata TaxID=107213 RepID=A0A9N9TC96_DIABA|nr:unnamed protein product [Diabrotica balteata]
MLLLGGIPHMKCCHVFLEIKEAIISTLAILGNDLDASLATHDWKIIQYAARVLKLFLDVTNKICAEKTVTLSKIIP